MGERRKILMVTGSLHIGGMENVAMNIIRYIDREKYDINFVVYGDEIGEYEREVAELGGNVFHISFPHQGFLRYCKEIRKIIKSTGPYDVVHSHNLFPSGLVMYAAKCEKVPIRISHAHTNRNDSNISIMRKVYQDAMRYLMLKYSTNLFACSIRAGSYLFGDRFISEGYVMNNGVSTERFQIEEVVRQSLKNEFNITDEKVIGHTGRFVEVKNHSFLLDVFNAICSKGEKAKLILIGDGPLKADMETKVNELGLKDKVIFTGMRDDVPKLLSVLDVYVLPSIYEGVSVSLMEAQASGVPFVVSESAYSEESKVTDYGMSLGLDEDVNVWRDIIIQQMYRKRNENAVRDIKKKGYDTSGIIEFIQDNFYALREENTYEW